MTPSLSLGCPQPWHRHPHHGIHDEGRTTHPVLTSLSRSIVLQDTQKPSKSPQTKGSFQFFLSFHNSEKVQNWRILSATFNLIEFTTSDFPAVRCSEQSFVIWPSWSESFVTQSTWPTLSQETPI